VCSQIYEKLCSDAEVINRKRIAESPICRDRTVLIRLFGPQEASMALTPNPSVASIPPPDATGDAGPPWVNDYHTYESVDDNTGTQFVDPPEPHAADDRLKNAGYISRSSAFTYGPGARDRNLAHNQSSPTPRRSDSPGQVAHHARHGHHQSEPPAQFSPNVRNSGRATNGTYVQSGVHPTLRHHQSMPASGLPGTYVRDAQQQQPQHQPQHQPHQQPQQQHWHPHAVAVSRQSSPVPSNPGTYVRAETTRRPMQPLQQTQQQHQQQRRVTKRPTGEAFPCSSISPCCNLALKPDKAWAASAE
jgi:hypothetical protein